MQIVVKNNEPIKAYKVLMKKLKKDGKFQTLRQKSAFQSKGAKRREKLKYAKLRESKRQAEKQEELLHLEHKLIYARRK